MPITITFNGTSAAVSGLTNGQQYSFRVAAANELGVGPFSAATAPGTPASSTPPTGSGVPGVPAMTLRGWINDGWKVRINAPTSDGGAPITHYEFQYRHEFNGNNACDEFGDWSTAIEVPANDPNVNLKNATGAQVARYVADGNQGTFVSLTGNLPNGTGLRPDGCNIDIPNGLRFRTRAVNGNGAGSYSYAPDFDPADPTKRAVVAPNHTRSLQGIQHGQSFFTVGNNWQNAVGGTGWAPYAITHGSGKFVTSCASSPDGENWTSHVGLGNNGGSTQYDVEHCNGRFFMAPLRNAAIPAHRAPAVAGRVSDDGRTWFPVAVPAGIVNLASGIHNGSPVFAMAHGGRLYGGGHNFGMSFSADGRTWQAVANPLGEIAQIQFVAGRWYVQTGGWHPNPQLYRSDVGSLSGWQLVFPERTLRLSARIQPVRSIPIGWNSRDVAGDGAPIGPTEALPKVRALVYEAYGALITYWSPLTINTAPAPIDNFEYQVRWCYSTDGGNTWIERRVSHPEQGGGTRVPRFAWPGDYGFTVGTTPVMTAPAHHQLAFQYECDSIWTLAEHKSYPGVIGPAGQRPGYIFPRGPSDTNFRGAPTHRWLCYRDSQNSPTPFYYPKSFAHDGNGTVVSVGPAVVTTDPSERWPDGAQKPAQGRFAFGLHKFPPLS